MKRVKIIFLWCGELAGQWGGWLPYWVFCSKKVRTSIKKHRQVLHSAKLKDVASAQSASAWYFHARIQAFLRGNERFASAMRKVELIIALSPQNIFFSSKFDKVIL